MSFNRSFLFLLLFFFLVGCTQKAEKPPPNIILIMADDLGYGGIGCYGNPLIKTPQLDSLASHGMKFLDFHANGSVCSPTRAALLTGRYQQRSGMEGVIYVRGESRQTGLDISEVTIAELMQQAGYATGIMGKWHLGYRDEYNPIYHGFDTFYGYRSGNVDYHSHYDNAGIYDWWHGTDSIREEGYVTDLITGHSIDFIRKNKDRPFFLYVAHEAPHVPFQSRSDTAYRFPDREFSYYGPVEDRHRAYREMIEVMDQGIGQIMDALRLEGLEENTLVIFFSDNGALSEYGSNGPLSGQKTGLLEGGHRVPAIAYWKGRINPSESNALLMTFDLMPTVASITGVKIPANLKLDGIDVSGLFFDEGPLPERPLFWRYREQKAVREGDWKLLISQGDTSLFYLREDLQEQENLAEENRSLQQSMTRQITDWETSFAKVEMKTQ